MPADLTGAGAGCLIVVGLMAHVGAEGVLMLVGAIASTAGLAVAMPNPNRVGRNWRFHGWWPSVLFGAVTPWATHLLCHSAGTRKRTDSTG